MTEPVQNCSADSCDLIAKAQAFVDRKYVARADDRQKSMGLAYVEAERQDLAREVARFATVAMGNAAEVGRLEIENIKLQALVERMTRAVKAANAYYGCYLQDEAEEIECCISPEQHLAAQELRDALRIAVAALTGGAQ